MQADDVDISGEARKRVVTWLDPNVTRDEFLAMDGPTFHAAITSGRWPLAPMLVLMGMRVRPTEPGPDAQIVFEADPANYHLNAMGILHGGFAATMLDSAIGHTVVTRLPAGASFTTLEIKIAYLRAMTERTGTVYTDTTVVSIGRRVASLEARLLDASGRIFATATSTCLILPQETRAD